MRGILATAAAVAMLSAYALLIRPGLEPSGAGQGASEIAVIDQVEAAEPASETAAGAPAGAATAGRPRIMLAERLIGCIERADGHVATIDRCHATFAAAQ